MRRSVLSFLLLCGLGLVCWNLPNTGFAQPSTGVDKDKIPAKASVNGKYTKLLRVLDCPQDRTSYGEFYDWGHWTGTSWHNHTNLPPGYWVYVAPNWYIWESVAGDNNVKGEIPAKASVNGKYTKLLKKISVPGDRAAYTDFNDWGYWTGNSWAGYANLPAGYWVYVYPHWYIWGQRNDVQAPARNQVKVPAQKDASVNGKYINLLKKIEVPQDKAAYGTFSDYGYYTGTTYAGYDDLPVGYWVYVHPHWYIWEEKK